MKQMAKDLDLFRAAMTGVKPLTGAKARREAAQRPKEQVPAPPKEARRLGAEPVRSAAPRLETFERDVDRALARGRRAPEASLDLHGMTLAAAERAVSHFLAASSAQGRRVVLIVTGKGLRLEGGRVFGGRIRAEFPGWLDRADNRALVAGVRAAHLRHGGSGAFYVLLRRRASPA